MKAVSNWLPDKLGSYKLKIIHNLFGKVVMFYADRQSDSLLAITCGQTVDEARLRMVSLIAQKTTY